MQKLRKIITWLLGILFSMLLLFALLLAINHLPYTPYCSVHDNHMTQEELDIVLGEQQEKTDMSKPRTTYEAVKYLDRYLSKEVKKEFPHADPGAVHMGLGRWIRNNLGLWADSSLNRFLATNKIPGGDFASGTILYEFEEYLKDKEGYEKKHRVEPPYSLEGLVTLIATHENEKVLAYINNNGALYLDNDRQLSPDKMAVTYIGETCSVFSAAALFCNNAVLEVLLHGDFCKKEPMSCQRGLAKVIKHCDADTAILFKPYLQSLDEKETEKVFRTDKFEPHAGMIGAVCDSINGSFVRNNAPSLAQSLIRKGAVVDLECLERKAPEFLQDEDVLRRLTIGFLKIGNSALFMQVLPLVQQHATLIESITQEVSTGLINWESDIPQALVEKGLISIEMRMYAPVASEKMSLLEKAAEAGNVKLIRFLVKRGMDPNKRSPKGFSSVEYGALNCQREALEVLYQIGGCLPSSWVIADTVERCGKDMAAFLLYKGIDINFQEPISGYTALAAVSSTGDMEAVKLLVDHGAETAPQEPGYFERWRPFITREMERIQIYRHAMEMADLQYGCDAPLLKAAMYKNLDVAKYLLEQGADVKSRECRYVPAIPFYKERGKNALHWALWLPNASYFHYQKNISDYEKQKIRELTRLFLDKGANKYQTDFEGKTPYDIANEYGDKELMELLKI